MRMYYKLCDAVDAMIDVTEQMRKDMIECERMIDADGFLGKDCKSCSWKDVKFNDVSFCEIEAIRRMVLGESGREFREKEE